jgi:hypothetical protein
VDAAFFLAITKHNNSPKSLDNRQQRLIHPHEIQIQKWATNNMVVITTSL